MLEAKSVQVYIVQTCCVKNGALVFGEEEKEVQYGSLGNELYDFRSNYK